MVKIGTARALLMALLGTSVGASALSAEPNPVVHAQALVQDRQFSAALKELEPLLAQDKKRRS